MDYGLEGGGVIISGLLHSSGGFHPAACECCEGGAGDVTRCWFSVKILDGRPNE
jgi:hypothetical protein